MTEIPIMPFVTNEDGADRSKWKRFGIPQTIAVSPYLGYYLCVGPANPVCVEKGSNQQTEINYTGSPGTASSLYYALTFQLLKWQYAVHKIDEWIEVSPTHTEYYQKTMSNKGALEGTIKEGLRSAAQAVADFELVKHDMRKYREMMDYLAMVEAAKKEKDAKKRAAKLLSAEHTLKSMYIDQVDVHTGVSSLVEMARNRWPTIISDFYSLTEQDETAEGIMKRIGISKAEAVVLKTKNTLFREWMKLFGTSVKERYLTLEGLVGAREKSIKEYQEWIKPYISRYKALKVGHERPEIRKSAMTSFADLTGQNTFSNNIRAWAFKPYRAIEYRKAPHVKEGKFTIDPYDEWSKFFIKDKTCGLAAVYPWLLNKGKEGDVADDIVKSIKDGWTKGHIPGLDPTELYYVLFDIDVLRLGLRLQTGELEDITFTIKTWMLSQNIMLVKLVEKECREREIERYIEEMLGIKKDDKPINEITKTEFSDLFGEKGKGKEPGELEKLTNEFKDAAKEMAAAKNAAGKAIGKHRLGFVKPGPYEVDFNERITKLYLIPSGRMLGTLIGLLLNNMGVG